MKEIHCIYCGNPVEPNYSREVGSDYHEECVEEHPQSEAEEPNQ